LPVISDRLFRVEYDGNGKNIFDVQYENWTDTEWLFDFFTEFKRDLEAVDAPISLKRAIKLTIDDADRLFELLNENDGANLSTFFKPLDKRKKW